LEELIMNKQTKVWLVLAIALSLLALGSACGGARDAGTNATSNSGGGSGGEVYSGATGSIAGVISFEGPVTPGKKIDTSADAACAKANPNLTTDDTIVTDGKLANVFVYLKEGTVDAGKKIGEYTWSPPSTPVNLDQRGCHYTPHVLGVQTNQKISITNSDQTQHNIHWIPKQNPEWNQSQANGAPAIEKTFARPEVVVPVKCNQHPWMRAYIGVMRTPFFDVSETNGAYEIKGVPPGKYTIVAWREGTPNGQEKTMDVTVPANGAAKADFSFTGSGPATTSTKPSLTMMPALELPMMHK
jgi:plastocyanin